MQNCINLKLIEELDKNNIPPDPHTLFLCNQCNMYKDDCIARINEILDKYEDDEESGYYASPAQEFLGFED